MQPPRTIVYKPDGSVLRAPSCACSALSVALAALSCRARQVSAASPLRKCTCNTQTSVCSPRIGLCCSGQGASLVPDPASVLHVQHCESEHLTDGLQGSFHKVLERCLPAAGCFPLGLQGWANFCLAVELPPHAPPVHDPSHQQHRCCRRCCHHPNMQQPNMRRIRDI